MICLLKLHINAENILLRHSPFSMEDTWASSDYYPLVLMPKFPSLSNILNDTMSRLKGQTLLTLIHRSKEVEPTVIHEPPPFWLALIWVVFCEVVGHDFHPTVEKLLSIIQATYNDGSLVYLGS